MKPSHLVYTQAFITVALMVFSYLLFNAGEKTIATTVVTATIYHWLRESVEMRKEEEQQSRRNNGHDRMPS